MTYVRNTRARPHETVGYFVYLVGDLVRNLHNLVRTYEKYYYYYNKF